MKRRRLARQLLFSFFSSFCSGWCSGIGSVIIPLVFVFYQTQGNARSISSSDEEDEETSAVHDHQLTEQAIDWRIVVVQLPSRDTHAIVSLPRTSSTTERWKLHHQHQHHHDHDRPTVVVVVDVLLSRSPLFSSRGGWPTCFDTDQIVWSVSSPRRFNRRNNLISDWLEKKIFLAMKLLTDNTYTHTHTYGQAAGKGEEDDNGTEAEEGEEEQQLSIQNATILKRKNVCY